MKTTKSARKEATPEPGPSFDAFCAETQLEQRRLDHAVPAEASHSFGYFQWRHAAACAFAAKHGPRPPSTDVRRLPSRESGEGRSAGGPSSSTPPSSATPDDPLVEATAALLLYTLAEGQFASSAPAALKRAREEAFPMPQASKEDAEALLAMAELTLRLSLARPADKTLVPMVRKVRGLVKLFIERGVVTRVRGGYPGIAFLMDLLSLRTIVSSWEQLDVPARGYVVHEMDSFSDRIRCTAGRALQRELASMRATGRALDATSVNELIAELASQVPYDFPRACHDALCDALQHPSLPVPSGQLLFSAKDGEAETEEEVEDAVEEEVMAPPNALDRHSATDRAAAYQPHPVLSVIAPPPRHGAVDGRSSVRASPGAQTGTQCTSKYHKRYSSDTSHASSLCPFCVVCHMMETLFNGYPTNCTYNHWPTAGKIRYNLRLHPHVKQLALARLEKSGRGESLKEGLQIPL